MKHFRYQIPSISPFCLKLESWLKLHGIKYQVRVRTEQSTPCHPWPLVTLSLVWWGSAASLLLQCRAAVRPGCCTGLCSPAAPLTAPSPEILPGETEIQALTDQLPRLISEGWKIISVNKIAAIRLGVESRLLYSAAWCELGLRPPGEREAVIYLYDC